MIESQPTAVSTLPLIVKTLCQSRMAAGKTIKQCAEILGISSKRYQRMENGEVVPSLPELDVLAYFLGISPQAFLHEGEQDEILPSLSVEQLQQLIQIRQRILASSLQLTRTQKKISFKSLAKQTGIPTTRLKRYEATSAPIPLNELIQISDVLEMPLETLLDQNSQLAEFQKQRKKILAFSKLPDHLRDFITQPENQSYLNVAFRLKEIGIDNLEGLAEGILKITEKNRS